MEKIRVYELAKQYGFTNKQMMDFLLENGVDVESYMSFVNLDENRNTIKKLDSNKKGKNHNNHTSLQRIQIIGLFGKYNYDFKFTDDINIWVSENGTGKTTILNIIVAILKGDDEILSKIKFHKIIIYINNQKIELNKNSVIDNRIISKHDKYNIDYLIKKLILSMPQVYYQRVLNNYRKNESLDLEEFESSLKRYLINNYLELDKRDTKQLYMLIHEIKSLQNASLTEQLVNIRSMMEEETLFYPTYRRIEISSDQIFSDKKFKHENGFKQFIGFGMDDVKRRIDELLKKMRDDANNAYIEMNSTIINELLKSKDIKQLTHNVPPIDRHKVEVIIKRIGEERIENVEKLKKFVKNIAYNPNEEFLKFYLDKLVKIYDSQKIIDDKLNSFVKVCNKYLLNKELIYDEVMLSMIIVDEENKLIDFEDLSSGEKQIVSIFSKVYLDTTMPCVLIIDEPEISLSIEWQKQFLVDIYNSNKVGLLIATTHSPFIFKNEFRNYTSEVEMFRR